MSNFSFSFSFLKMQSVYSEGLMVGGVDTQRCLKTNKSSFF